MMSEETKNVELLSDSVDEFLDAPVTKVQAPVIDYPEGEENVCVQFHARGRAIQILAETLKSVCASGQRKTVTHKYALLTISPGTLAVHRVGYCDVLTANTLVYRLCAAAGVEFTIFRDFGIPERQRVLCETDVSTRAFRF